MWYSLAVSRLPSGEDRDRAIRNRNDVEERMTAVQIAESRLLTQEWRPSSVLQDNIIRVELPN